MAQALLEKKGPYQRCWSCHRDTSLRILDILLLTEAPLLTMPDLKATDPEAQEAQEAFNERVPWPRDRVS